MPCPSRSDADTVGLLSSAPVNAEAPQIATPNAACGRSSASYHARALAPRRAAAASHGIPVRSASGLTRRSCASAC